MAGSSANQSLIWSDDFLIGIEELDYEHRRLIEDINRLHRELREQIDMDAITATLGSIYSRIQAHFALEERVMGSHSYVHYPEHKAEHERLLDEYAERMSKFDRDPNPGNQKALEKILRKWIVDHILTTDKKMSLMIIGGKQT
jgi:hemerythrin-like metal-binding protein